MDQMMALTFLIVLLTDANIEQNLRKMFKIPLGANKFAHNCIRLCVANENNVPSLGIYDQQLPDCMLCRYLTSHAGTCRKSGNIMMSQELCFLERPPFSLLPLQPISLSVL